MSIRRALVASVMSAVLCGAPAQLNGFYTIHPQRLPSATNFQTIAGAMSVLRTAGVTGPVVLEMYDDAGPYSETHTFYASPHATLGNNLPLGNNQCTLLLSQFPGVSATNRVTFRAAPGERPVLDASGKACGVYFNGADYVTLEGLEIRNATHDGVSLYAGVGQNSVGNEVKRCVIRDCGAVGIACIAATGGVVSDTLIQGNLFSDCMQSGGLPNNTFAGSARDGYVACRRDTNTQVIFNTFLVGTLNGASLTFTPWVVGQNVASAGTSGLVKIEGNLFVKTTASGTFLRFATPGTAPPALPAGLDRNVYWSPPGIGGDFALYGSPSSPTTLATFAAWQVAFGVDAASAFVDPLIGGPLAPPHNLLAGSPCIGAGPTTFGATVTTDLAGHPRDAAPDVGCDEFVGNPAATITYVGSGCAGGSGLFQTLLAAGRPALGNASFALTTPRANANTTIVLFVAFAFDDPALFFGFGCRLYLSQASLASLLGTPYYPFAVDMTLPGGGYVLPLPLPNDQALAGFSVNVQTAMFDAGAPLGFTLTNALSATLN